MKLLNTPEAAPDRMARRSRWNAYVVMALALAVVTAVRAALTPTLPLADGSRLPWR